MLVNHRSLQGCINGFVIGKIQVFQHYESSFRFFFRLCLFFLYFDDVWPSPTFWLGRYLDVSPNISRRWDDLSLTSWNSSLNPPILFSDFWISPFFVLSSCEGLAADIFWNPSMPLLISAAYIFHVLFDQLPTLSANCHITSHITHPWPHCCLIELHLNWQLVSTILLPYRFLKSTIFLLPTWTHSVSLWFTYPPV